MTEPGVPLWASQTHLKPKTRAQRRVLLAAQRLFDLDYSTTTLEHIALAADVSAAMIYKAFGTRAAVAAASFSTLFETIAQDTVVGLENNDDSIQVLTDFILKTATLAHEHPNLTRALMDGIHSATLKYGAALGDNDPRSWAPLPLPLIPVIELAQREGRVRDDMLAADIASSIANFIMLRVIQRESEPAEYTAWYISEMLLRGVLANSGDS